jgi:hypothetical protein
VKYTVTEGPSRGGFGQYLKDRFAVRKPDHTVLAFMLTEAEANIYAFALNTVANSKPGDEGLAYVRGEGDWDVYTGPTEGVAPV